jgi:hypothetical protein
MSRVALLLGIVLSAALHAQAPDEASLRYGITTSKDTVTVGEVFTIRVRIRAPSDAEIRFPDNPDTAGTVQGRDPRTIEVSDTVQFLDLTAVYHVAAWDVGRQTLQMKDAVVIWGAAEKHVPIDGMTVFVRSVLPADSTLRVPKPQRAIFEATPFPWWLLALLLAAIAIGLGIWWWMRRRQRPPVVVAIDPYARAVRELNRIEALGLLSAGERTRFAALIVEVLRDYLAARFPDASLALTSRELVALLRKQPTVPLELLSRVLHEADLAKFAAFSLATDRARSLASDARKVIEHEHRAARPPQRAAA